MAKLFHIGTLVGVNSTSDGYRTKGFKKVFDSVYFYDYRKKHKFNKLWTHIGDFKPDIIFINKAELIPGWEIQKIKKRFPNIFVAYYYGDSPEDVKDYALLLGKQADVLLVPHFHKQSWNYCYNRGVKLIIKYYPGTDLDVFKKMDKEIEYDIAFAGTRTDKCTNSALRYDLLTGLSEKYRVAVAGGGAWKDVDGLHYKGFCYGEELSEFYSKSKFILSIDNNNTYAGISNRIMNALSCSVPVLMYYFEGYESLGLKDGYNVIVFKDFQHLLLQIEMYMKSPDLCKSIGENGRKLISEKHTYEHKALELKMIWEGH